MAALRGSRGGGPQRERSRPTDREPPPPRRGSLLAPPPPLVLPLPLLLALALLQWQECLLNDLLILSMLEAAEFSLLLLPLPLLEETLAAGSLHILEKKEILIISGRLGKMISFSPVHHADGSPPSLAPEMREHDRDAVVVAVAGVGWEERVAAAVASAGRVVLATESGLRGARGAEGAPPAAAAAAAVLRAAVAAREVPAAKSVNES